MTAYVALLRGVNVGGNNKVPMATLRELCEGIGGSDVRTYVQSGNVVFGATRRSTAAVAAALEAAIATALGLTITVVVRTAAEMTAVVAAMPFPTDGVDPTTLHVGFLRDAPTAEAVAALAATSFPPNEYTVIGREVHLRTPDGLGRTKLPTFDRVLGTPCTVRNWRTVVTLTEMATGR